MKNTTEQIYNFITNSNFEKLKQQLIVKVKEHNWQIQERQEYTYEEFIEDLPDCIDILKQSIEDNNFDYLSYQTRYEILQIITQMNSHIANIYAGHQQFANLMDYTQNLKIQIRTNRLDFETKRIPRYKEKLKEYKELINELSNLNIVLDTTKSKQTELLDILKKAEDIVSDLQMHTDKAKKSEEEIDTKLENSTETYNQINALLATIQEHRENINEILQEAKSSNTDIKDIEAEVNAFIEKVEDSQDKASKFIKETEDKINLFISDTENIVETNKIQQQEIDNQLQKAVGVSLFSTFAKRKEQLAPASWGWLFIIIVSVIGMSLISYDIISSFIQSVNHVDTINSMGKVIVDANNTNLLMKNTENMNSHIGWIWVFLKMTLLLPLIYLISFATTRYGKERRLIEEYAFKSTISLALTPYADLIKKIEEEGTDSKYRDFLISSIENIFSAPTDKAFGFNKHSTVNQDKNNGKIVDEVLNLINKAKKAGQDI